MYGIDWASYYLGKKQAQTKENKMTEIKRLETELTNCKDRQSDLVQRISELSDKIARYKIKESELKFPNAIGTLFWFSDEEVDCTMIHQRYTNWSMIRPFSREEIRFDGEHRYYGADKQGQEVNHGWKYAKPVTSKEINLYC